MRARLSIINCAWISCPRLRRDILPARESVSARAGMVGCKGAASGGWRADRWQMSLGTKISGGRRGAIALDECQDRDGIGGMDRLAIWRACDVWMAAAGCRVRRNRSRLAAVPADRCRAALALKLPQEPAARCQLFQSVDMRIEEVLNVDRIVKLAAERNMDHGCRWRARPPSARLIIDWQPSPAHHRLPLRTM